MGRAAIETRNGVILVNDLAAKGALIHVVCWMNSRQTGHPEMLLAAGLPTTDTPLGLRSQCVATTSCRAPTRSREWALSGQCRGSPAGSQIGGRIWLVCVCAAGGDCLHGRFPPFRSNELLGHRGRHCGSGRGRLGGWILGRTTGQVGRPLPDEGPEPRDHEPFSRLQPSVQAICSWMILDGQLLHPGSSTRAVLPTVAQMDA